MNRRTGLGRGLAALIPPQQDEEAAHRPSTLPQDSHEEPSRQPGAVTPRQADASLPPVSSSAVEASTAMDGRTPHVAPAEHDDPPAAELTRAPDAVEYREIPLSSITANPRQPREVFDPDELEGLATSLLDVGILQPLVVRPTSAGGYELVAGERRLRAAELAGIEVVPAVVRRTEDADLLKEALVENIHRVQLNPLEEAAAYQQLLDEFGVTQDELASQLGRSRSAITNAIRLLRLPSGVQRRVAAGVLSAGHARALLALEDSALQQRLADRIVAEGLSVRDIEEIVRLKLTDAAPTGSTRSRRGGMQLPGLAELQQDLSDALQTRVKVSMGARRGRLAIEFGSVEDLERIVGVIATGLGVEPASVDPDVGNSQGDHTRQG